jgi:hypothetical protein
VFEYLDKLSPKVAFPLGAVFGALAGYALLNLEETLQLVLGAGLVLVAVALAVSGRPVLK